MFELEPLSIEECHRLLTQATVGRVGISVDALPVVLPVNYAVMDGDIVIRTESGTKLDAALRGAVVAFEVDDADAVYHDGWSVLVQGRASEITEESELERARLLPLQPWAPGERNHFMRIAAERLTGRRLALAPDRAATPST